jgi:hypothetical protein
LNAERTMSVFELVAVNHGCSFPWACDERHATLR